MIKVIERYNSAKIANIIYNAELSNKTTTNLPNDKALIEKYIKKFKRSKNNKIIGDISKITASILLLQIDEQNKNIQVDGGPFIANCSLKLALAENIDYLQKHYLGYAIDFSINPNNTEIYNLLVGKGGIIAKSESVYSYFISLPFTEVNKQNVVLMDKVASKFDNINKDLYWTKARLMKYNQLVLVYIEDDEIKGYIHGTNNQAKTQEIINLVLTSDNQNIAYQLLWNIIGYYARDTKVTFNIDDDNLSLSKIVLRFGFKKQQANINIRFNSDLVK